MGLFKTLLLVNGVPVRPTTKRQRNHKVARQSLKVQQQILSELQTRREPYVFQNVPVHGQSKP